MMVPFFVAVNKVDIRSQQACHGQNDVETTSIYVYTTLFQRRLTMVAIISTLLFQINIFERYSRFENKKRYKLSPSLQTLLLNNKF